MPYLRPATQYEFWVTGFTQKREGVSSPVLRTRTDTAKPGPPVITNTNCTGVFLDFKRQCFKPVFLIIPLYIGEMHNPLHR